MKLPTLQGRLRHERGATLIVLLVMLVIVTLLTLSSLRSTTQEERMAGNFRDRDRAFQAAEAAVQTCLTQIRNDAFAGTKLAPVVATSASAPAMHWDTPWTNANSTAVTVPNGSLASEPRCMVETLGGGFRVTGRAVGADADTVVMLQATFTSD